jgi:hypothetical protein
MKHASVCANTGMYVYIWYFLRYSILINKEVKSWVYILSNESVLISSEPKNLKQRKAEFWIWTCWTAEGQILNLNQLKAEFWIWISWRPNTQWIWNSGRPKFTFLIQVERAYGMWANFESMCQRRSNEHFHRKSVPSPWHQHQNKLWSLNDWGKRTWTSNLVMT